MLARLAKFANSCVLYLYWSCWAQKLHCSACDCNCETSPGPASQQVRGVKQMELRAQQRLSEPTPNSNTNITHNYLQTWLSAQSLKDLVVQMVSQEL